MDEVADIRSRRREIRPTMKQFWTTAYLRSLQSSKVLSNCE
jgi:hypothetical protein